MNTGHDGSMGTLHANTPREALSRLESMITMGGYSLPSKTIREMIVSSVDVVDPGRAPARRLAPHHAHHRGDGHGRRRDHHAGRLPLRDAGRGRRTASSSAATARPASAGRGSGNARAISATRNGSAQRSTPPKSPANRTRADAMAMQIACHFCAGRARGRRADLGVRLSDPVGRAEGREAPGKRRRAQSRPPRVSRPPARNQPEGAPRQSRKRSRSWKSGRRSRRTCRLRCASRRPA